MRRGEEYDRSRVLIVPVEGGRYLLQLRQSMEKRWHHLQLGQLFSLKIVSRSITITVSHWATVAESLNKYYLRDP